MPWGVEPGNSREHKEDRDGACDLEVLAETSRPVLLEGNVYFPPEDVRREHLARTRAWSVCPWKGVARYYTVRARGQVNQNAAWYYPHPSPLARKIKKHVAFWNGAQVDTGAGG